MLETTLSTMRARGYLSNVVYFPDESFYPAREAAIEQLIVSRWYNGPNIPSLARCAVDMYRQHMQLALQMSKYQLDEAQLAALLQLLILRYGRLSSWTCDAELSPFRRGLLLRSAEQNRIWQ